MNRVISWAAVSLVMGALATASPVAAQAGGEVLTNQMIIDMVNAKLPRAIIITRIQGSRNTFDVTTAGLVFLRQREISTAILEVMLQATPVRPPNETLSNDDVIGLVEANVPRDLIIAKIRNTRQAFDVTTAGLVFLQQRKVPQQVIKVMIEEASAPPSRTPPTPPAAPPRRPIGTDSR